MQKALRRLSALKVPTSVSQLVMWRLTSGLGWDDMARAAEWATPYEVTLARDFVEHTSTSCRIRPAETGTLLFEIERVLDDARRARRSRPRLAWAFQG